MSPKARDARPAWPPHLNKAVLDNPFQYACGLRDGTVIEFEGATPGDWAECERLDHVADAGSDEDFLNARVASEWVHLEGIQSIRGPLGVFPFERGLDIRLSEIVWVADAPRGS